MMASSDSESPRAWRFIEIEVAPGPLGILLDGTVKTAAVLDGFTPISSDGTPGPVEAHGEIPAGSTLVAVNQYEFEVERMSFLEIGRVLRETAHLTRMLRFRVPAPPMEEAEEEEEEEETLQPLDVSVHDNTSQHPQPSSNSPLSSSYEQIDEREVAAALAGTSLGGSSPTQSWSPEDMRSPREATFSASSSLSQSGNVTTSTTEEATAPMTTTAVGDTPSEPTGALIEVEVPSGPLGLTLDGMTTDCAVVAGFVPLPDGSTGALEQHGGIPLRALLTKINGQDVSRTPLSEIYGMLGNLSGQTRTLEFQAPPPVQLGANGLPLPNQPAWPPSSSHSGNKPVFLEDLDKRRKLELALVMKHDSAKLQRGQCWILVSAGWMNKWVEYAARGGPLPGPITNNDLLVPEWEQRMMGELPGRPDEPLEALEITTHYRAVPPMIWCLLVELHGTKPTPVMARYMLDIYADPLRETEITSLLTAPRLRATTMVQELREKCQIQIGG